MQRELLYEYDGLERARRDGRTIVVNLRAEEFDVYIGRAGRGQDGYFGNPYTVQEHGLQAIELFRSYFLQRIESEPAFRLRVLALKGKRLGCFCKPKPCHGDVIAEWVEANAPAAPGAAPSLFQTPSMALSLWQPWAWVMLASQDEINRYGGVFTAPKRIENRSWPPPDRVIGKPVLVHASKTWDEAGAEYIAEHVVGLQGVAQRDWPALAQPGIGFVGAFKVVGHLAKSKGDVPPPDQVRWYFGPFGWLTAEPRQLKAPVRWRGMQGVFAVPDAARAEIERIGWEA